MVNQNATLSFPQISSIFLVMIFFLLQTASSSKFSQFQRDLSMRWMQEYFHFNATDFDRLDTIYQMPLDGSTELGYYYASLFVGSPPQKQTLIVDTGSGITAFPCSGKQPSIIKQHRDP